ncbi:MAG: Protein phosphatase methylesterase 1 [Peltula sp. TS41687]|nr:MAG: Protein phosphatase methylesterase 1 [Peltula sp. TS41687]
MAADARGHGETVVTSTAERPLDLSLAALSNDMIEVIRLTQNKLGWTELPELVFVGHSLGGAVVSSVAKGGAYASKLLGYAVLDVVEGFAMEALKGMQAYLSSRPSSFASLEDAIDWHHEDRVKSLLTESSSSIQSRTLRNPTSARVSVPALLRQETSPRDNSPIWVWRTDLVATQPLWENWFIGMSKNFLEGKGAKLLMLAGTDRLDKELMIGQMQGKYQLLVFPEAGHFIHEDIPEKSAAAIVEFYRRNDRSALVLPPKVSEMLKNKALKGDPEIP